VATRIDTNKASQPWKGIEIRWWKMTGFQYDFDPYETFRALWYKIQILLNVPVTCDVCHFYRFRYQAVSRCVHWWHVHCRVFHPSSHWSAQFVTREIKLNCFDRKVGTKRCYIYIASLHSISGYLELMHKTCTWITRISWKRTLWAWVFQAGEHRIVKKSNCFPSVFLTNTRSFAKHVSEAKVQARTRFAWHGGLALDEAAHETHKRHRQLSCHGRTVKHQI
jgi:hypothetical protein